ncbi:histidine phosphatase family protein [Amycolatopsis deserti]|uniref:histidine phosphatase family protein n=1 Tax=Amycolatopsis deserti TaxID=185696 RepID=UPI0017490903|nr:histidine phosphatase family protein [Amycolatopsis deserti]
MENTGLVIARHGESRCGREGVVGGPRGCTGLTELGRWQAARLAAVLAKEHDAKRFAALYATSVRRVAETAEIVAARLDLPLTVADDLRDPDYGEADGRPWREVLSEVRAGPEDGLEIAIAPGAETWKDYFVRVTAGLTRLLDRHHGERILVIGHGETVTAAAHLFLRLPPDVRVHAGFEVTPTGITRWERQALVPGIRERHHRWVQVTHNDTAHLGGAGMASEGEARP